MRPTRIVAGDLEARNAEMEGLAKPESLNTSDGWDALLAMPGVKSLDVGTQYWRLEFLEHLTLSDVVPLLAAVAKQCPSLPQVWEADSQEHCFYGRDAGPTEAHGVFLA